MQLLSQPNNNQAEKQAFSQLAKGMGSLASRKDFIGGLLAPIPKLFGGMQKVYGRGQQGAAALRQGLGSSADDLLKNPAFQRGSKNVTAGKSLREQAGLRSGLQAPNPWSYRAGRGLGAVAVGAPLMNLPFTAATYAGAANADPALAEEYAKNMAYDRVEERIGQFRNMPFLERAKTIFKPQDFSQQLRMPEATDLYQSMADNNLNNPGIMKYLASFNPFAGSPNEVISQKVRSEMMKHLQPKSASEKCANIGNVLKGFGAAWRAGRGAASGAVNSAVKGVHSIPYTGVSHLNRIPGVTNIPIWEAALQKGIYNTAKSPGTYLGNASLAGLLPYAALSSYDSGKQQVYDSAANNAAGMADLGIMEKFNQPGFMGGLGRAGMAIAPGMFGDMVLNQVRQSMFPEVNQQQR
jgi:hypothetical protein